MVLEKVSDVETHPLKYEEVEKPKPNENDVLVQVDYCGVCRTDLHVVEGDIPPMVSPIIPGHEIVGRIVGLGKNVRTLSEEETVGIPWLHHTCGKCEYCITARENLCENKVFTGYTVNGGYAQYALGVEGYVVRLPEKQSNEAKLAPFLCAGIIGYRALKVALPRPGGRIGFFGFGGSAHLTLQLASKLGYETVGFSRNPSHLKLAQELGATDIVLTTEDRGKETLQMKEKTLDSAIVFAPAGEVVIQALRTLKKGGLLSIAAIHMSTIPPIDYDQYLFGERKIMSVESNTRADAQEFLDLARRLKLESTVSVRSLKEANEALIDLKEGKVVGAFVLDCGAQ
jgi:alcohol dehydrogenase, propanol-preferring